MSDKKSGEKAILSPPLNKMILPDKNKDESKPNSLTHREFLEKLKGKRSKPKEKLEDKEWDEIP